MRSYMLIIKLLTKFGMSFQTMAENPKELIDEYNAVAGDDEEKDRYQRRTNKDRLLEVIDSFKTEYDQAQINLDEIRRADQDKAAELTTRQATIDQLNAQVTTLNNTVDDLRRNLGTAEEKNRTDGELIKNLNDKMEELSSLKQKTVDDLVQAKTQILRKDAVAKQLMEKLQSKTDADSWAEQCEDKIKILVIVEKKLEGALSHVVFPVGVMWNKFTLEGGVDSLRGMVNSEEHRKIMYTHDKVILLVGLYDIEQGREVIGLANALSNIVPKFKELKLEVALCQIIPSLNQDLNVDCFNMRLSHETQCQVINIENEIIGLSSKTFCNADNTFDNKILVTVGTTISNKTVIPPKVVKEPYVPQPTQAAQQLSQPNLPTPALQHSNVNNQNINPKPEPVDNLVPKKPGDMISLVPVDSSKTGRIIGKGGVLVKALQTQTGCSIRVVLRDNGKVVRIEGAPSKVPGAIAEIEKLISGPPSQNVMPVAPNPGPNVYQYRPVLVPPTVQPPTSYVQPTTSYSSMASR